MDLEITLTRYWVTDGAPQVEHTTWRHAPDDPMAQSLPQAAVHAAEACYVANAWRLSVSLNPAPLGAVFLTREQYQSMIAGTPFATPGFAEVLR